MDPPKYDVTDKSFINFVKTIALSTTAFFAFNPTNDVIRAKYAKDRKLDPTSIPSEPDSAEMIAAFK